MSLHGSGPHEPRQARTSLIACHWRRLLRLAYRKTFGPSGCLIPFRQPKSFKVSINPFAVLMNLSATSLISNQGMISGSEPPPVLNAPVVAKLVWLTKEQARVLPV